MSNETELAFVATMRDEASKVAKSARASLDSIGGETTPIVTKVKVDAAQAQKLLDVLPRDAKGAIDKTSAVFDSLSPAAKKAVQDADAAVKQANAFASLPAEVKAAVAEAERIATDGLKNAGEEAGKEMGEGLRGGLESMKGKIAGGIAALGVGEAFSQAMDFGESKARLAAALGATPALAKKYGDMAARIYSGAWGDSMDDVSGAIESVKSSIRGLGSGKALETATTQALNYASTFEVDVTRAAQVAGNAISNGLAKNSTQAFDLLTRSSQKVPKQLREDVLDAADEYGQFFHSLGFNGQQAFGALTANAQKGMYGIDKAGDAVKEFTIRSTDGSKATSTAFESLGLPFHKMSNDLLAGGDTAQQAFQKTVKAILSIKDPSQRAQTALTLFGTPLEDMNVKDIPAFLKSLTRADGGLGRVKGAADRAGKTLNDNARTNLTSFGRTLKTQVVNVIGGSVVPKVNDLIKTMGPKLTPILHAAGSAIRSTGKFLKDHATTAKILAGVLVTLVAAEKAHAAVLAVQAAGGIVSYLKNMKLVAYATKVWAAVQWVLNSALLANPITLIVLAVIALIAIVVLLVKHWDTVKKALLSAWDAIKSAISSAISWIVGWVKSHWLLLLAIITGPFGLLIGLVVKYWAQIKGAISNAVSAVISWVKEHWRLILGIVLGPLGLLIGFVTKHWAKIKAVFARAWGAIKGFVSRGIDRVKAFVSNGFDRVKDLFVRAAVKWHDLIVGAWDKIKSAVSAGIDRVKTFVSNGWERVKALFVAAAVKWHDLIVNAWGKIKSAVSTGIGKVVDLAKGIGGRVKNAIGDLGRLLWNTGKSIIGGLIDGIESMIGAVRDKLHSVTKLIPDWKGPMRVDRKLLTPTGSAIMGGLIGGIAGEERTLKSQLSGITDLIASTVAVPDLAAMSNAAAMRPFVVRSTEVVTIRHEVVSPDGTVSNMTADQIADLLARDPKSSAKLEGALRGARNRRAGSTISASR